MAETTEQKPLCKYVPGVSRLVPALGKYLSPSEIAKRVKEEQERVAVILRKRPAPTGRGG